MGLLLVSLLTSPAHADQHLVFLGSDGPKVIKLKIHVDGQSPQMIHQRHLARWFSFLDSNRDRKLDKKEIGQCLDAQTMMRLGNSGIAPITSAGRVTLASFGKKAGETVSFADFSRYYERFGFSAYRLVPPFRQTQNGAGEELFHALDRNKDKHLTKEEVGNAIQFLRAFDLDDDERLSSTELMSLVGSNPYVNRFTPQNPSSQTLPKSFYLPASAEEDAQMAVLLLTTYDLDHDGLVDFGELKVAKTAFEKLDSNSDGKLNSAELAKFVAAVEPTSLEIPVSQSAGSSGMMGGTMKAPKDNGNLSKLVDKMPEVTLGGANVAVKTLPPFQGFQRANLAKIYLQQFRDANMSGKLFLSKSQLNAAKHRLLLSVFDIMDQSRDGKLTQIEVLQFSNLLADLNKSFVSIQIAEDAPDFFKILDRNNDNQLIIREIQGAWENLEKLDANQDHKISMEEFAKQFTITVNLGPFNRTGTINPVSPAFPRTTPSQRVDYQGAPLWFQRMDVNNDGDVSRREFLGRIDQFAQFDRDGNGLIDPKEAMAEIPKGDNQK